METEAWPSRAITLNTSHLVLTLDYATEVGGFVYIDVGGVREQATVDIRYGETFYGLESPTGDGAWVYSTMLSSTFETDRLRVARPGTYRVPYQQGGFRWQSLRLVNGSGINITKIGVQMTREKKSPEQIAGTLQTSSQLYNDIYDLGGQTVQNACFDADSQPSTWNVISEGVHLFGQAAAVYAPALNSADFDDHWQFDFETKILDSGTGWAAGTYMPGPLLQQSYFVLTSEEAVEPLEGGLSPQLGRNTLTFTTGYSVLNTSAVSSGPLVQFSIPFPIVKGQWYHIATKLREDSYSVSINDHIVAVISWSAYKKSFVTALDTVPTGSWGFGPFLNQEAIFRNAKVVSSHGTLLYSDPLNGQGRNKSMLLYDYTAHTNDESVFLDAPKRDRLVWTGDFYHTSRVISKSRMSKNADTLISSCCQQTGATTGRFDHAYGTLRFVFARQFSDGLIPIAPLMGSAPEPQYQNSILLDYQILFLLSLWNVYEDTGDVEFVRNYWNQTKHILEAVSAYIDPSNGLLGMSVRSFWLGPINGTAPTATLSLALRRMASVATDLGDIDIALDYTPRKLIH